MGLRKGYKGFIALGLGNGNDSVSSCLYEMIIDDFTITTYFRVT